MSLFGSKWAGEILLETKRIFGLDHDASEQEVHEHLRTVESFADVAASLRTEIEKEFTAPTEREKTLEDEKQDLENRAAQAEQEAATLRATVAALKKEAEDLKTEAKAKADEIERLKAEPATKHTGGETQPQTGKEKLSKTKQLYEQYGIE